MKYIIMCGGEYKHWETPRQLSLICGEELVARTIRLLRENGIEDIAISSNNPIFKKFGVPVLKHDNLYITKNWTVEQGDWYNAFYPTNEPTCYLFGDVCFSEEAIKTIIEAETDDIEFFGSKPPFAKNYIKTHEEPFALKVVNTQHLKDAINKTRELDKQGKFWRQPIMWELWTVIKDVPLQTKLDEYPAEYVVINDYTCDIDWKEDARKLNCILGGTNMVRCKVISDFSLKRFDELKNIVRKNKEQKGFLFRDDMFECDEELADYLTGNNAHKRAFVKVIEVIPKIEFHEEKKIPRVELKLEDVKEAVKDTKKITTKKKKNKK